ncbi:MAG: alkaline phosphatase family protein [Anaerolineae bacterium]|nr:alkaline phosphatase family protein [Anaerolineae bacterium]
MTINHYPIAEAVRAAYRAGEEDEALEPIILANGNGQPIGRIGDGDYVIFYDIRGEREIELTSAFVAQEFPHFDRAPIAVHFATMIEYASDLVEHIAFPPIKEIRHTLSEIVSQHGLKQVKISESEKAIHVRYFLNGKREELFPGEVLVSIPSPEVANYAETPKMSAAGVAQAAIEALNDPEASFIVVNFCNVDVVGHIEDRAAVLRAVEEVDRRIGQTVAAAQARGVTAVVTADHGTVEKWLYPEGSVDTGHTDSLVPFIVVDSALRRAVLQDGGALTDVAPTLLQLLGLPQPDEMTGHSLLPNTIAGQRKPFDFEPSVRAQGKRVMLVIADGWGARDDAYGNMILEANTPVMDRLEQDWPSTRLEAAGEAVGMPAGTVGNSEAGHTHIGAGRLVLSDRVRIDQAITDGSFAENEAFRWAMEGAKRDSTKLHLLGIISFYSSHGSIIHLKELMKMAHKAGIPEVYVHGMLGRRGERPESGAIYTEEIEKEAERLGNGMALVSIIGRFWSLDREENWDRIEKTYRWLVEGKGQTVSGVP